MTSAFFWIERCRSLAMKIVGLLWGREYSLPPAFISMVNQLGAKVGVTAELVKLGGTKMGEKARYSVIVDRISHEVEYYRGYLKHAAMEGTYVINNPFWWTADDKFFNTRWQPSWGLPFLRPCCCRKKAIRQVWISPANRCTTWSIRSIGTGCWIMWGGRRS